MLLPPTRNPADHLASLTSIHIKSEIDIMIKNYKYKYYINKWHALCLDYKINPVNFLAFDPTRCVTFRNGGTLR